MCFVGDKNQPLFLMPEFHCHGHGEPVIKKGYGRRMLCKGRQLIPEKTRSPEKILPWHRIGGLGDEEKRNKACILVWDAGFMH